MQSYRSVVGALAAGAAKHHDTLPEGQLPFVTISRQAAAGAHAFKDKLVQRLNIIDKADPQWSGWDHELVNKVAEDHNLSTPLLETLDEAAHSYINDLLSAAFNLLRGKKQEPTELMVYRRVAKTIRALAKAGRVVIVGRGGMFITGDMPGGVHICLVAPLEHRIETMRQRHNLAHDEAAAQVRQIDENRNAFYRRHWPHRQAQPETFNVTFNTAVNDEDEMIEALLPLIPGMRQKDERHKAQQAKATKGDL